MYPDPTGPDLTSDEAKRLDDDFLRTNPTAYFRSRLDSLLVSTANADPTDAAVQFQDVLGPVASANVPRAEYDRELQVAIDAVQLRAHVAETLLRLLLARLKSRESGEGCSLWVEATKTPTQTADLLREIGERARADGFDSVIAGLFLPLPDGTELTEDQAAALGTFIGWVNHSMMLLRCGHIDLAAVSNKIKHGLVIRPNAQMRLTFTTQTPGADDTVNVSALSGENAYDIFDTVVLEYISRPPGKPKHGLELTLLRVDPAVVLAETWMLIITHGALFHTSAYRHFGESADVEFAAFPGLPLGPSPEQVQRGKPIGMRFPLTTPPGGGPPRRGPGLAFLDAFVPITITGPATRARVVDD